MEQPRKSLGQHWLKDDAALAQIADSGQITSKDIILEIGSGPGFLTKHLVPKASQVIAVELDEYLARGLSYNFRAPNLKVIQGDILKFDLTKLPAGYKVVANIPYYLTGKLLRLLTQTSNPPSRVVLLVQKEVAERIDASPGKMSLLAVSVQLFFEPKLGAVVPAGLFTPAPKVDSQILILKRHPQPLFDNLDERQFFQVVKAGFSTRRKKLRSSLSGGLQLPKDKADRLLEAADINGELRAEALSLQQWHNLYLQFRVQKDFRSLLPS